MCFFSYKIFIWFCNPKNKNLRLRYAFLRRDEITSAIEVYFLIFFWDEKSAMEV